MEIGYSRGPILLIAIKMNPIAHYWRHFLRARLDLTIMPSTFALQDHEQTSFEDG
jgi:hypothetical protein